MKRFWSYLKITSEGIGKNSERNKPKAILHVKYLIKQLTSYHLKLDFMFNSASNNNNNKNYCKDYSYQCLFFWCLLNGRIELAKFFWKHVDVRKEFNLNLNLVNIPF